MHLLLCPPVIIITMFVYAQRVMCLVVVVVVVVVVCVLCAQNVCLQAYRWSNVFVKRTHTAHLSTTLYVTRDVCYRCIVVSYREHHSPHFYSCNCPRGVSGIFQNITVKLDCHAHCLLNRNTDVIAVH